MFPRTAVLAVVCCCLLLATPFAPVVAGAAQQPNSTANGSTANSTTPNNSSESPTSGTADRCFTEEGYEFTIGTQGPEIRMVLHLSLLTNLGGPGAIGVELSGSIDGPPIIELKTGVVFEGIDDLTEFLNDPFGAFSIAFDYQFSLPVFGGDYSYNDSEVPIQGPIGDADCTFG